MRKIRAIFYEKPEDAYYNLAVEEAIPRALSLGYGKPTIRFFRNENAVIIGYFQYAEREVNLREAELLKVQVVRRFTGGGAVYHDLGNLNYAISLPFTKIIPTDIVEYYRFFLKPIVNALKSLGATNASLGGLNDLNIETRKVGGTAASRKWGVAFFHGTLLINTNLGTMARLLTPPLEKLKDKGVTRIRERVVNLSEILGSIKIEEVVDAIVREFEKTFEAQIEWKDDLTEKELSLAEKLYAYKYTSKEWNYRRKPSSFFDKTIFG